MIVSITDFFFFFHIYHERQEPTDAEYCIMMQVDREPCFLFPFPLLTPPLTKSGIIVGAPFHSLLCKKEIWSFTAMAYCLDSLAFKYAYSPF